MRVVEKIKNGPGCSLRDFLFPFGSCWPLLRPEIALIRLTTILSTSLIPTTLSPPCLGAFTPSCHHSHLNLVRKGADREDWFPVRRCLERILELSGLIHPPLLHSNLRGWPCLPLWLCCRHTHILKIHKKLKNTRQDNNLRNVLNPLKTPV